MAKSSSPSPFGSRSHTLTLWPPTARIASAEIADALEGIASLNTTRPRAPRSVLPSNSVPTQFLQARTCYDHLAGETAVQILEGMLKARWLTATGRDFQVS